MGATSSWGWPRLLDWKSTPSDKTQLGHSKKKCLPVSKLFQSTTILEFSKWYIILLWVNLIRNDEWLNFKVPFQSPKILFLQHKASWFRLLFWTSKFAEKRKKEKLQIKAFSIGSSWMYKNLSCYRLSEWPHQKPHELWARPRNWGLVLWMLLTEWVQL